MAVDEFANALLQRDLQFVEEGGHENPLGQRGYRATYFNSSGFLWFSVSGTDDRMAADEVAVAITAPERQIMRENP